MTGTKHLVRTVPFVAIMATASYLYYVADNFDFPAMPGRVGPDLWPKAILGLMIATCAVGIVRTVLSRRTDASSDILALLAPADAEGDSIEAQQRTWLHLPLLGIALLIAYVVMIDVVGFVICTAVLIAALLYLGRYRNPTVIIAASLVGGVGFFYVFRELVYISLPLGREPFLSFSVLLMKLMGMS